MKSDMGIRNNQRGSYQYPQLRLSPPPPPTTLMTTAHEATSAKAGELVSSRLNSLPILGWKRVLDLSCILLSLPIVMPLMGVIVLWIRLVSRGPALFRQERIGQDGKRFVLYKFRSMRVNCGTSLHEAYLRNLVVFRRPMMKLDLICDSRLIPGGCFLRSAGLDELPQLMNVLMGDMSLVGPRPCLLKEYRLFSTKQRERFKALPGLTGIWQVNGKNRTTFREMNLMDVYYANHGSLALDIRIMIKTPGAILFQICQAFHQTRTRKQIARFETSAGHP